MYTYVTYKLVETVSALNADTKKMGSLVKGNVIHGYNDGTIFHAIVAKGSRGGYRFSKGDSVRMLTSELANAKVLTD